MSRPSRLFVSLAFAALAMSWLRAESFDLTPTQIDVAVASGINHRPVRVPITYDSGTTDLAALTATSDASWVNAAVDVATGDLVLTFTTAGLVSRTNTATIVLTGSAQSDQLFVRATVALQNIVALVDDPVRSRTYGLQQDGLLGGSVVVFDPIHGTYVGNITVGLKPTDLVVNGDGSELLVICSVSKAIAVIDLTNLSLKETIVLPLFDDWGSADTSANIDLGPADIIYYTDGAWAPMLHVLRRSTNTVLQSTLIDPSTSFGWGDLAVTPNKQEVYGWAQYGWSAGVSYSFASRFSINPDGTLTFQQAIPATYPAPMARDPLQTPVLVSLDGGIVVMKKLAFMSGDLNDVVRTFAGEVYAMTPNAEVVCTDTAIYDLATGNPLYTLPVMAQVQVVTSDYARLVYFDPGARELKTINLLDEISSSILGRDIFPADGSVTLAPDQLRWTPLPGIDRYRVFLGASLGAVTAADTTAPEYLGEVTTSEITVPTALAAGLTYYWRVDAVGVDEVTSGDVYSFTVSTIALSQASINAATVRGHRNLRVDIDLTSATSGVAWSASSPAAWVSFAAVSGSTPATLGVILDAGDLPSGTDTTTVVLETPAGPVSIPVRLKVDPLALTLIKSDPGSARVYAISEDTTTTPSRAYLLEIDSATEAIMRVIRVGTGVTDLAIHHGDNRLYVANWRSGDLLAINLDTLALARTYAFTPFGQIGYGSDDVYRVSAGGPGRVVVEEYDQWIYLSIFDTTTGTKLGETFVREGGGSYSPDGRYYYHGENNSSGAALIRFDTVGDVFTSLASKRVESASYYGSRVVVVSENGQRVFWNGSVFDPQLVEEWTIGEHIYSTSADGRLAFAQGKIYDIGQKRAVLGMPVETTVSAYNATTAKLVVQMGGQVRFFAASLVSMPAPQLLATALAYNSVRLDWSDESLETGFTLQYRKVGTGNWTDVSPALPQNTTSSTVAGLLSETAYDFRIKADASSLSSAWSDLATATTLAQPPELPYFTSILATGSSGIALRWVVTGTYDHVVIERALANSGTWVGVASVPSGEFFYQDSGLTPSTGYWYRMKSVRGGLESAYVGTYSVYTDPPPTPPVVTQPPAGQTVRAGGNLSLYAGFSGSPPFTYQWRKNGVDLAGQTASVLTLVQLRPADAGDYTLRITNDQGTVETAAASIVIQPCLFAGTYFGQFGGALGQWALFVRPDATATYLAAIQQPAGALIVETVVDPAGNFYGVSHRPYALLSSPDGGAQTAAAVLNSTVNGTINGSVVTGSVSGVATAFAGTVDAAAGSTANVGGFYAANAIAHPASAIYVIAGNTSQAFALAVTPTWVDGGFGTIQSSGNVVVATVAGTQISGTANGAMHTLSASAAPASSSTVSFQSVLPAGIRNDRLGNISSRGRAGAGNQVMIAGFIVNGPGPRTMLIRGAGPALAQYNVSGLAEDPYLELFDGASRLIKSSDDWGQETNATEIAAAAGLTGAFPFPAASKDAALLVQLDPGAYTAISQSRGDSGDLVLTEVYDVTAVSAGTPGVLNVSLRGEARGGDQVLIAGFVVLGNSPKRVLVRAVGPTLSNFSLDPATLLANPRLNIYADGDLLVQNDNWGSEGDAAEISTVSNNVGAFALPPGSKDAVILTTLMPGLYTAHASGVGAEAGTVLVEVYQIP